MTRLRRFLQSPSFWPLQIAGWTTYLVMIVATFWPQLPAGRSVWALVQIKVLRTLIGFTITCGLRPLLRRYATGAVSVSRVAAVALGGSVVGGLLWLLLYQGLSAGTPSPHAVAVAVARVVRAPREALDYSLTLLCWSALYLGLRGWRELQDQRARALEATALAQQAQLDALRYQLNPHFLFNGLNSIRALVDEDAARARRMITALSEFLRYPLTSAAGAEVALATELDAVRNYLAIEQIRFEERLRVAIDVTPEAEAAAIPSFLLHPLVENAIKHGFASADGPLTLRVGARVAEDGRLWLDVRNSGRWRPTHDTADRQGTGTGLRNVQARLAVIAPASAETSATHHFSVEETDEEEGGTVVVRVALPYHPFGTETAHAALGDTPPGDTGDRRRSTRDVVSSDRRARGTEARGA